ncbi:MAG: hypothetical protein UU88_C0008G0013 [Parcubacteria group bacterium GW2011_GWC1_42_11]|uniref:Uncharacterized protein n=1 Tax=Candidatus Nomurabacteria bacterium GW2011_GWC2_42_20 TaxID=1618756 RepID=A0A0G1BPP8_9BACT|nr:MAG: hypothetical protein UU88_C0008G0013 [Parcubacteria group bacterium GW2011_GWC1_42_11]KKS48236.1 MAG: hypothetical protein UV12_C0002G0085 [Candidatus Nomurabacteria bacterium GW2011_GWC2_42_20]KKS59366.1 MAG: hypothetical protein UV24_C0002G0032 [Candidatus Nomurabacteria bacterium GW2011_GWA2_42_41]KKT09809.1 MAG: hypothetical protein UV86_C0002G0052 [Candidatus Nomurabacteria bacterium GW2011_GWB1_43_20]
MERSAFFTPFSPATWSPDGTAPGWRKPEEPGLVWAVDAIARARNEPLFEECCSFLFIFLFSVY